MLTSMRLVNFKAFADTGVVPLRPLTLIYGPNSAGKSAFIQALLLLKQSLDLGDVSDESTVALRGPYFNGTFRDLIHRHDLKQTMRIRLLCHHSPRLISAPRSLVDSTLRDLDVRTIGVEWGFRLSSARRVIMSDMAIFIDNDVDPVFAFSEDKSEGAPASNARSGKRRTLPSLLRGTTVNTQHKIWPHLYNAFFSKSPSSSSASAFRLRQRHRLVMRDLVDSSDFAEADDAMAHFLKAPPPVDEALKRLGDIHRETLMRAPSLFWVTTRTMDESFDVGAQASPLALIVRDWTTGLARYAVRQIRAQLDKLAYLDPLRSYPSRHYFDTGAPATDVGFQGGQAPEMLFKDKALERKVRAALRSMSVPFNLRIRREDSYGMFLLEGEDTWSSVRGNIMDFGFGISQVLPIVTQIVGGEAELLVVAQPEIHLHPALQADLADLFISSATAAEPTQFFLETHSEHLALRILRRIRETSKDKRPGHDRHLKPDDVALLYVDPSAEGRSLVHIPVTEAGEFARLWPQGFFGERLRELV